MASPPRPRRVSHLSVIEPDPVRLSAPPLPAHLGKPEAEIWKHIFEDFDLSTRAAIAVLVTALEAHQRARECREAIAHEGMTVTGRDGQLRPHPLLDTERDARQAWLAAIKALGLEL